jgi:hypothetical protein
MNDIERKIYYMTNTYLGYGRRSTTKKDIDEHFNKVLTLFSDEEIEQTSFLLIKDNLYHFWGIKSDIQIVERELVPMPVNKKAQAKYNKRFGIEE